MKVVTAAFLSLVGCASVVFGADSALLGSERRAGYTLETHEFYPDEQLAVKALVLVPDGLKAKGASAAVFMPEDATSLECLAGEPDPYASKDADLGRKAYFAARSGMVAVALVRPAMANAAPDDVNSADSRKRYLALLPGSGWSDGKLVAAELKWAQDFLRKHPSVNAAKIAVNPKVEKPSGCPAPKKFEGRVLASGKRMMCAADYEPERPDGRTAKTMTWAMLKLRAANAPKPRQFLKDAATFKSWRDRRLEGYRKFGRNLDPNPEFKLLSKEDRPGYTLCEYEFYPFEGLAVRTYVLYPDNAKPRSTPVVVCMPGGGASLECLAGERGRDHHFNRYPVRNRQCWYYAQCGMIAVALENPANASNAHPEFPMWNEMMFCKRCWSKVGFSVEHYIVRTVAYCINFLKHDVRTDPTKIALSGLSRGASILYAAAGIPEISAMNYNDFVCDSNARRMSVTDLPSGESDGGGADYETLMALAPKSLILNEGGAWKGLIEDIVRAYKLSGHPENLTIHYYDRYRDPRARRHENVDVRTLTGLTSEEYYEYTNCDPYDHSFHPESALPWLRKLFFGSEQLPVSLRIPLLEAKADREWMDTEFFPPDGRKNRWAWGERPFDEKAMVPERPDGRTMYTATWAKMLLDGKVSMGKAN